MKPRKLRLARIKKGTPLEHIIKAHKQFKPKGSLRDNLGDGFLCALHPVYKNIRQEALKRKIKFESRGNEAYFAFPLMALDEAIAKKTIPYRPNAPWLEKLPSDFTLSDLKAGELQFNYLFHESAHLIAHDEIFKKTNPPKSETTLLAVMIGEAFANMVECLSAAFAEGEIMSFFLDANCHFRASEKEVKTLLKSGNKIGWANTAKVLLAAFLYSNYLVERLTPAEERRIQKFAGINTNIKKLTRIGLQLNEKFRTTTTPLHLRKTGFKAKALPRFLNKDPLKLLEEPRHAGLRSKANRLAEIAAVC